MLQKRLRGQPLATVAPRSVYSSAVLNTRTSTESLAAVQAEYLAARFGLDGVRARVVAELAWGPSA